jgi:RND superfamily putative drug exporter
MLMLTRLGTFAVHRAKLVLAATVLLLIGAGVLGLGAFGKLAGGGFEDPGAESSRAATALADRFGAQADLVLVVDAGGPVDRAAAAGQELTRRLAAEPDLTGVSSYWSTGAPAMRSADGTKALVVASISGDPDARDDVADRLIGTYGGQRDGLEVAVGGQAGVNHDINVQVGRDLALAEAIAVPIILVLLALAFGSVVAALLPLAIGTLAIAGTFAELSLLGSVTDVSIYSINLTTALGLGLAIDYALLMVSRYREELGNGADVPAAVIRTVETAGRTIIFSAATVAVALAALLLFPLYFLRSFAYAGIGVIAIAMTSALVVLPALLTVLGHRVNAGRLPWVKGTTRTEAPFWGRLAALVMRRPGLTALPVVVGLVLLATPLLRVDFGTPDDGSCRPPATAGWSATRCGPTSAATTPTPSAWSVPDRSTRPPSRRTPGGCRSCPRWSGWTPRRDVRRRQAGRRFPRRRPAGCRRHPAAVGRDGGRLPLGGRAGPGGRGPGTARPERHGVPRRRGHRRLHGQPAGHRLAAAARRRADRRDHVSCSCSCSPAACCSRCGRCCST